MKKGFNFTIPLIFAIIFALGSAGAAIVFNSMLTSEVARLKRLKLEGWRLSGNSKDLSRETLKEMGTRMDKKLIEREHGEKRRLTEELSRLRTTLVGKDDDPIDVVQLRKNYLEDAKKRMDLVFKGRMRNKQYSTLVDIYPELFVEVERLRIQLSALNGDKQGDLQKYRLDLEAKRASFKHMDEISKDEIDKLRKKRESIRDKLTRTIQEREDERDDYKRKFEESNRQKDLMEENYKQVVLPKLKTEIANLTRDIQKLKETIRRRKKMEDMEADGLIVAANQNLGYVWLNLGRAQGLQKGFIFKVFQYVKGGAKNYKGKVEVVQVDVNMARARILQQTYRNDPLIKGDYIISPIFDRNQKNTFVFAGQKAINRMYSPEKYKRMLENRNQVVQDQVNNRTDFIILLEKYEQTKEYEDAKNFPWIIFLREKDLLDYLQK